MLLLSNDRPRIDAFLWILIVSAKGLAGIAVFGLITNRTKPFS
jgi:hypothetical protein